MSVSSDVSTGSHPLLGGGDGSSSNGTKKNKRMAERSESMAYPKHNTAALLSKLQFYMRHNSRAVVLTLAFVFFLLLISSDYVHDARINLRSGAGGFLSVPTHKHFGGAVQDGYFYPNHAIITPPSSSGKPNQFRFAAVTDMDELSRVEGEKKLKFRSLLLPGTITRTDVKNSDGSTSPHYDISFEPSRTLYTKHNEAGRGGEFSELTIYNNRLLTFDDRTGDVFEILNNEHGSDSFVVPRFVITEGDGETDKGMKWEWSTVHNGELYMGSMGKAYTDSQGNVMNRNNLWIAVLNANGEIRREDWTEKYDVVRGAVGAMDPGYTIMEAVNWSDHLGKWVFLPRRISAEMYDENKDERRGGNQLVMVNPQFTQATAVKVQMKDTDPLKGFSTFAFVPGTNDLHAMAIRSVEEDCVGGDGQVCKQRSYFLVFHVLTGQVLSDEVMYTEELTKFEGLEFVDVYTKPPPRQPSKYP